MNLTSPTLLSSSEPATSPETATTVPTTVPGDQTPLSTAPADNGSGASPLPEQPKTVEGATSEALRQFSAESGKPVNNDPNGGINFRPTMPPKIPAKRAGKNPPKTDTPSQPPQVAINLPFKPEEIDDMLRGLVRMLNETGANVVSALAKKNGLESGTATELAEAARMGPETENMITKSGGIVLRKYLANYQFLPEAFLAAGILMWGTGVYSQIRAIKNFKANQQK